MSAPSSTERAIRVANAPCSWGVLEFDELQGQQAPCERVLQEMAAAGYGGTELGDWGFLPTEPAALRELLGRHGLQLVGGFVPVALGEQGAHPAGQELALRTARLMAAVSPGALVVLADDNGKVAERVRCAGRIGAGQGLSEGQWDSAARCVERIARAVREAHGLRTVFHHHCAGYVETPAEVAALMQRTDPELVGLCLDTGHWAYGGGDVLRALEQYGERIWHVHFKGFEPQVVADGAHDYFEAVQGGVFCELDRGAVPLTQVVRALGARGYRGWAVVEQDVLPGMGSPLTSARRSREYLTRLGL